jgi:hypothetical protein
MIMAGHSHSCAPIVRLANIFARYCAIKRARGKSFVHAFALFALAKQAFQILFPDGR